LLHLGSPQDISTCAGHAFECVCRTVLNGNGKLPWELEEAARQGVLINVDSEFDLDNIFAAAKSTETPVKVLLRINPDVDPKVRLL
jgi:diaminopimelate decarboxylase